MDCREISLENIDFEDETFRISEEIRSQPLLTSIREVGQLNPVVFLQEDGRDRIVCGFRRLDALRQLNISKVIARFLKNKNPDSAEVFDFALWDNLSHRRLNPLEKARILYKLKNDFGVSDRTLIQSYLPRLNLKPHEQVLRSHLVLHESHHDFRRYYMEGRLTLASLEYLSTVSVPSREIIASTLGRIRLSASLQKKFFNLLEDLAAMAGTEPVKPLENLQVQEVLDNARLSPAQRGEEICDILYRFRYPIISQAEKRFLEKKQSLDLPGSIRIKTDPYFETPGLNVEFRAHDAEHFRKLAEKLFDISRKPELEKLFKID